MKPEDKLAAIIEAQVRGGHLEWAFLIKKNGKGTFLVKNLSGALLKEDEFPDRLCYHDYDDQMEYGSIEILLDPAGLKAAYRHMDETEGCICVSPSYCDKGDRTICGWCASGGILDTWLSTNGDAAKTIDTAYDLLPKD